MEHRWTITGLLMSVSAVILVTQPAVADSPNARKLGESNLKIFSLSKTHCPLTHAAPLLAQDSQATLVEVTGVQINQTKTGIEVILASDRGAALQPITKSEGNTYTADISNATLRLPSGSAFRQDNPAKGIASVTVTNVAANSVRVTVTGTSSLPKVELFDSKEGLIFGVATVVTQQPTPQAEEEQEVVVTATRTEEEIENVPRTVRVITREEFDEQTAVTRSLGDILGKVVPGLSPPDGTNRPSTLRGRPPAILIDGVSQISNDSFSPSLSFITPDQIERIEVVSGPSAIYGQGATGGIINIITKRPSEDRLTSTTEAGITAAAGGQAFLEGRGFDYYLGHSISGTEGNFDYTLNASGRFTNSAFDARGDLIPNSNLLLDDAEILAVLGKMGVNFSDRQRLQLTFNHTDQTERPNSIPDLRFLEPPGLQRSRGIRQSVEFRDADKPGVSSTNVNLNYTNENLLGSQVQAIAYYRQADYLERTLFDDRDSFFGGIIRTSSSDEVFGGRLQIETPLANTLSLLWGADYERQKKDSLFLEFFDPQVYDESQRRIAQRISTEIYVPPYDLDSLGLFAQLQWDLSDRWRLSGGVRHEQIGLSVDDYTPFFDSESNRYSGPPIQGDDIDFNDTVFNFGTVYNVTEEVSLFANFAQGFAVPGFGFGGLAFPPPEFSIGEDFEGLQPQKVDNYEIGIRGNWDSLQASLSAFYNYSDLGTALIYEADGSGEVVRAPQKNYGLEASFDWQPGRDWQLGSALSYLIGQNDEDDDGEFLDLSSFDIPPLKLTAYVQHQTTPGWRNRVQMLLVGDRDRGFEDDADLIPVEGYLVVDLLSNIKLGQGELIFGIQNLFDNQYQSVNTQLGGANAETFNYAERGRTLSVNYRITW